jgi:transposase
MMSDGPIIKPECIPQEAWDQSGPAARACFVMLVERLEKLERLLGMNSGNSSRPPSTDGPGVTPPKTKAKSSKKRGGQVGHVKRVRPLIPTDQCDSVKHYKPSACADCGTKLSGTDSSPARHQVTELPTVKPIVTEHQIHSLECPQCGKICRGQMPLHVPAGSFGPTVVSTVTMLSSLGRLSQRMMAQLLRDLFDLEISDGQISRLQTIGRKALQSGYEEITADVRQSAAVNMDETGWRENGLKAWLWTVVGRASTLFSIRRTRSRSVVTELLGAEFGGIIGSDRYSAYSHLDDHRHQFCWAHLLRDFQAMIERKGPSTQIGTELKSSGQELIHHWNRLQGGAIRRATFDNHYRRLRSVILDTLESGASCSNSKTAEVCRRLGNECYSLFVFVHHSGVSPTNNVAERALRKSVIFRKLSFGTEASSGSQNMSVILSVVETCRRLNRHCLTFIKDAVQAFFSQTSAPALIPVQ